jgi:hypothetical protein
VVKKKASVLGDFEQLVLFGVLRLGGTAGEPPAGVARVAPSEVLRAG